VIKNYKIAGDVIIGQQYKLTMKYPPSREATTLIESAKKLAITEFNTIEKLNNKMQQIQDSNDGVLVKYLESDDQLAKNQTNSFLADIMTIFKTRLEKEAPKNTVTVEVIEAAEDFRTDCISEIKE
jgi:hypothetical protein